MSTAKRAMIVRPPGLFQSQSNSQAFWRPFRFKINPFAISPNGANGLPAKKELPGKMSRKGYFAPLLSMLFANRGAFRRRASSGDTGTWLQRSTISKPRTIFPMAGSRRSQTKHGKWQ
jgi:hypothetical protein